MRESASGFCCVDDLTVAISWLLSKGSRVAYIFDIDVHHGDGVEATLLGRPASSDCLPSQKCPAVSLFRYGLCDRCGRAEG